MIVRLPADAGKIGLTKDMIQNAAEARLRSARIYTAERFAAGAAPSTLRVAFAAVRAAHTAAGLPSPTSHPAVGGTRGVLAGTVKRAAREGRTQRQAKALTPAALAAVRAAARIPSCGRGGRMESPATAERRGRIDMVLCMVMTDGGQRRSEAAELRWGNLSVKEDGIERLTVRRPKTDAEGAGAVVALTAEAVRDLEAWRALAGEGEEG